MLRNTLTLTAPSSSMHGLISRSTLKKEKSQIEITINNELKVGGKVTFKGVGDGNPKVLTKTSWVNSDNHKKVSYTISVNRTRENINSVTIEDHMKFTNASYVPGSIKIIKRELCLCSR